MASSILAVSGAALGDIVLLACSVLAAAPIAVDLPLSIMRAGRCSAEPDRSGEERVWIWEARHLTLRLSRCTGFQGIEAPGWLELTSARASDGGSVEVVLTARFRSSGLYRLESLAIRVGGPLGLAYSTRVLGVGASYRVLPEALYWVLQGLRVLGFAGGPEGGSPRGPVPGRPLAPGPGDYLWSRDYTPGDPGSRVDWRATSRLLRLVVKEYGEQREGGVFIVADYRCYGPRSCDALASALISTAIYLASASAPVRYLYERDSGRLVAVTDARRLLAYSIEKIFERGLVDPAEVAPYQYAEPMGLGEIRALLREVAGELGSVETSEGVLAAPPKGVSRAFLITCLAHDVDFAVDAVEALRRAGMGVAVIAPERPWLDSRRLEDAYRIYTTFSLAVGRIRRSGAEVILWDGKGAG